MAEPSLDTPVDSLLTPEFGSLPPAIIDGGILREPVLALTKEEKTLMMQELNEGILPRAKSKAEYDRYTWAEGEPRYTLTEPIGKGGMAWIYEGKDNKGGKVAIKVIRPDVSFPEILELEAKTMEKIRHQGVVSILNFFKARVPLQGVHEKASVMIMEYMDPQKAPSMERVMKTKGVFSLKETDTILTQLADTVDFMAQRGILHRDLKPGNIYLDQERNQAKISDFGISSEVGSEVEHVLTLATPLYMSPEVTRGEPATIQSEIFSLASVAYQMVTGRVPFPIDNLENVGQMMHIIQTRPPTPISIHPTVNIEPDRKKALDAVFDKALAKEPGERYQTATAFAQAFQQAAGLSK